MEKVIMLMLAIAVLVGAQLNVKTTEIIITNFRADSTYVCPWMSLTDGENVNVTTMINDTSASGYANDSIAAIIGVQYGAVYNSFNGIPTQTELGPVKFCDSIRTGRFTSNTWVSYDSFPETYLDTNGSIGYAFNVKYLQPFVNDIFRPVLTGLTGNEEGTFQRVKIVIKQRKWSLAGKN